MRGVGEAQLLWPACRGRHDMAALCTDATRMQCFGALSRRERLPCRVGSDELFPGDSDHGYQAYARLPTLKLHFAAHPGLVAQLYLE